MVTKKTTQNKSTLHEKGDKSIKKDTKPTAKNKELIESTAQKLEAESQDSNVTTATITTAVVISSPKQEILEELEEPLQVVEEPSQVIEEPSQVIEEVVVIATDISENIENGDLGAVQEENKGAEKTQESNDSPVEVTVTTSETTHGEEVSNMFGTISKHYDLLNHLLSFGIDYWWRYRLINSIIPGPKGKILDMAAGTLDVSLAILRKYSHVNVVAGDICEAMLKHGEKKIRAIEKDRIECQIMDAQEIPHENESFDAVTIAFGIRNVEDRLKALKEMNRVLVTGGQLCILEFSPLTVPYMGKAYHWYLENIVPKIAKLFGEKEDAYQYLAKTIKEFPAPDNFCDEIKEAGFNFIRHEKLTFGIVNLYVAIKT